MNERLTRLADLTGRTRSYYVSEALNREIDKLEYGYQLRNDSEDYRAGRLKTYSLEEVSAHCGLDDEV